VSQSPFHTLLCLDYDGTLTPIVKTPAVAQLSPKTRALIKKISRKQHFSVAVVSGRALRDVKDMVRVNRIVYAGNHGLEVKGLGLRFIHPKAKQARTHLRKIRIKLKQNLRSIPKCFVEDKTLSLSVHYRTTTKKYWTQTKKIVKRTVSPWLRSKLAKLTEGKCVIEVRPNTSWDKGACVKWLTQKVKAQKKIKFLHPIYIGDDKTDEAAFQTVNQKSGISIFVGPARNTSKARFQLASSGRVFQFLKWLEKSA
jgi:trehalose 6-phosphate phosphatase